MNAMPNTMKIGMGLGFVGGIIAIWSMAVAWNGTVDSAPLVGGCMAVAMMFFATAGCFSSYSPVKGSTAIVLSALIVAFVAICAIYGAIGIEFALILAVLGIACMVIANMPSTRTWIDANRI